MEENTVQDLNLTSGEKFLNLIEEGKELLDKGATPEGRMEYMRKLKKAMLDEKSASLASKYTTLISEVMDPNTDSALNSNAYKRLGALVADKMDMEKLHDSADPKMQSALKVIEAFKSLSGLTALVQHNFDPNDITQLSQETICEFGRTMLSEFDLEDNAMDLAQEGSEFAAAGAKIYAILSTQPFDPFALVHAGQAFLKEGADVLNEFNEATPAIHTLVADVQDGLSAIYEHASNQYDEYSEIIEESYEDLSKISTDFQKEMQENWEEANDGDGKNDGIIPYGILALQSGWKASVKGMAEVKDTISELIWQGHEEGDEKVAEEPVIEPVIEEPAESSNSIDWHEELSKDKLQPQPVEIIHGFEGVQREESYPELDLDDLINGGTDPLQSGADNTMEIPVKSVEVI